MNSTDNGAKDTETTYTQQEPKNRRSRKELYSYLVWGSVFYRICVSLIWGFGPESLFRNSTMYLNDIPCNQTLFSWRDKINISIRDKLKSQNYKSHCVKGA